MHSHPSLTTQPRPANVTNNPPRCSLGIYPSASGMAPRLIQHATGPDQDHQNPVRSEWRGSEHHNGTKVGTRKVVFDEADRDPDQFSNVSTQGYRLFKCLTSE